MSWTPQYPDDSGVLDERRGVHLSWRRVVFVDGTSRAVLSNGYETRANGILAFPGAVDPLTGDPLFLEFGPASWRSVERYVAGSPA